MNTLAFMPLLITTLCGEAEQAFPEEVCGILIGREMQEPRGAWRLVERVAQVANMAPAEDRKRYFMIDPKELLRVEREAEETGQVILGFYHSHPDGAARPSATDTQLAWPVYSYVILALHERRTVDITSWRLEEDGKQFKEQAIVDSTAVDVSQD